MPIPPDKQPPGGWVLKLYETGGTVSAPDFLAFVKAINEQMTSNGFTALSREAILERMKGQ